MSDSTQLQRGGCLRGKAPVFLDLMWEETASPVLSFVILLKLSKAATFGLLQLAYPASTCHGVAQVATWPTQITPLGGNEVTIFIMCGLAVLLGGVSVTRWLNTARLLPLALAVSIVYLATFSVLEMAPCVKALPLARSSLFTTASNYSVAVAYAFTLAFYDLLLCVTFVLCLLRQCISHRREIVAGRPIVFPFRDVRTVVPPPEAATGVLGKARALIKHWGRVAAVAPLRHKAAAMSATLLLLIVTVTVFSLIAYIRYEWSLVLSGMNSPPHVFSPPPGGAPGPMGHRLRSLLQSPPISPATAPSPAPFPPPSPPIVPAPAPAPGLSPPPSSPIAPPPLPAPAPPFFPSTSSEGGGAAGMCFALVYMVLYSLLVPFVAPLLDSLGVAIVVSFVLQLLVFKRTFDLIYADQQRIVARLGAARPGAPSARLLPEAGKGAEDEEAGMLAPAAAVQEPFSPLEGWEGGASGSNPWVDDEPPTDENPFVDQAPPTDVAKPRGEALTEIALDGDAPAGSLGPPPQPPARATGVVGGRFADGTVDVVGSFAFLDSCMYMGQFAANALLSYALNFFLWFVIVFLLRFRPSMPYTLVVLFIGPVGATALKLLHSVVLRAGVVRGNRVYAPRTLLWLDFILTFTLGGLFGVACTVPRFVFSIVHLFSRLVVFQQPILPASLARLDPAFTVYGGLLKSTFMPYFDENLRR